MTGEHKHIAKHENKNGGAPSEGHLKALQDNRLEVEDLGVEVDGAEGARGDDHTLELGKHGLHCQASIQAAQLQAHHSNGHGIHGVRQQERKQGQTDGRRQKRRQESGEGRQEERDSCID